MLKPCVLHATLKDAAERGELVTLRYSGAEYICGIGE